MSTYLPKDGSGGSAYQEGGGLFALGNYSGTPLIQPQKQGGCINEVKLCNDIKPLQATCIP